MDNPKVSVSVGYLTDNKIDASTRILIALGVIPTGIPERNKKIARLTGTSTQEVTRVVGRLMAGTPKRQPILDDRGRLLWDDPKGAPGVEEYLKDIRSYDPTYYPEVRIWQSVFDPLFAEGGANHHLRDLKDRRSRDFWRFFWKSCQKMPKDARKLLARYEAVVRDHLILLAAVKPTQEHPTKTLEAAIKGLRVSDFGHDPGALAAKLRAALKKPEWERSVRSEIMLLAEVAGEAKDEKTQCCDQSQSDRAAIGGCLRG